MLSAIFFAKSEPKIEKTFGRIGYQKDTHKCSQCLLIGK